MRHGRCVSSGGLIDIEAILRAGENMKTTGKSLITILSAVLIIGTSAPRSSEADDVADSAAEPFVYDFYYKVKWGYFGEWMELYKRNHYPVLKRLQEMGRILSMEAAYPVDHDGEADRWDLRFTIVYPSAAIAFEDFDRSALLKELYPDQEKFRKEEQRRFELLIEHKDVAVWVDDLADW